MINSAEPKNVEMTNFSPNSKICCNIDPRVKKIAIQAISTSLSTAVVGGLAVSAVAITAACSSIPAAAIYTVGILALVGLAATPPGWLIVGGLLGVFITTCFLFLAYKLCITAIQAYSSHTLNEWQKSNGKGGICLTYKSVDVFTGNQWIQYSKKEDSRVSNLLKISNLLKSYTFGIVGDILYVPRLIYSVASGVFSARKEIPKRHLSNAAQAFVLFNASDYRTQKIRGFEEFMLADAASDAARKEDVIFRSSGSFNDNSGLATDDDNSDVGTDDA